MKATETTILNFVGGLDKAFIIPPFQRNYEWDQEQCQELFTDIENICRANTTHYLGNVTYYCGENNGASYTELVLIDGQQRITSILLLLCALRDRIEDESIKNSINKRYLINDASDEKFRVRLKQTAYDSNEFNRIVEKMSPQNTKGKIYKNYIFLLDCIDKSDVSPQMLYESLTRVEIVEVNLQISNNLNVVQTVFEKINSTGKPLSAADLIRNLLLTAPSASEQERLYTTYWIEIERLLETKNVSRFARDYMIMKLFEDIPDNTIYKTFKQYYYEGTATNEDILTEMKKLSAKYAWIKFENCPDDYINRRIKMLNMLKTEDLYPLYLFLLDRLYDVDLNELRDIFNLLTDYMLRFRIVRPSGGGGSLRSNIQELIENISSGTIECTYDTILYELSNSASPSNRFPLDEEFKAQLMESVSANNARVLLLKIEETETKNIPVPIEKVTVEHLMPQTLSAEWKEYLGGEEKANETFERYLNCIGNLTIVSSKYNSSFKNYSWNKKKESLQNVQFVIASEIPQKYNLWCAANIEKRNEDISDRALKSLIAPLKRERQFRTRDNSGSYEAGVYPISDQTVRMEGSAIVAVIYKGSVIKCDRWKDLLVVLVEILNKKNSTCMANVIDRNEIHKATNKQNYPHKDPVITRNRDYLIEAISVKDSEYFCEGCISSARARVYAKQLLSCFNEMDDIYIEIE